MCALADEDEISRSTPEAEDLISREGLEDQSTVILDPDGVVLYEVQMEKA